MAIISNPEAFVNDIRNSIGFDVKAGLVNYFKIANGYDLSFTKQKAIDKDYLDYLTQDTPPVIKGNQKRYSFCAKYVYRSLLCKDEFFSGEQEYRILLPYVEINEGKLFHVSFLEDIKICDLDEFFNN